MKSSSQVQLFAILILLILNGMILIYLWPYMRAFLAACVFAILFAPLFDRVMSLKWMGKKGASVAIVTLSTLFVGVPLVGVSLAVSNRIAKLLAHPDAIIAKLNQILASFPVSLDMFDLEKQVSSMLQEGNGISNFLFSIASNITAIGLNVFVFVVTYYFILIYKDELVDTIILYMPFNSRTVKKMIGTCKRMTSGIMISNTIVAFVQAVIVTIGAVLSSNDYPFIIFFVTFVCAFIPLVGSAGVWIPLSVYYAINSSGYMWPVLIAGLIASLSDNIIRPPLQTRFGEIHPLVTIFGILVGLPLFGLIGIVFGPILISFTLELSRTYAHNHLTSSVD